MNRKGQELSLTTIILAALGLIILVVLAAVFTGRIGSFGLGLSSIEAMNQCNVQCKTEALYSGGTVQLATEQCASNKVYLQNSVPALNKDQECCCKKKAPAITPPAETS